MMKFNNVPLTLGLSFFFFFFFFLWRLELLAILPAKQRIEAELSHSPHARHPLVGSSARHQSRRMSLSERVDVAFLLPSVLGS